MYTAGREREGGREGETFLAMHTMYIHSVFLLQYRVTLYRSVLKKYRVTLKLPWTSIYIEVQDEEAHIIKSSFAHYRVCVTDSDNYVLCGGKVHFMHGQLAINIHSSS